MKKFYNKVLDKLVKAEPSAEKLAWSITLGTYLAFSPYLGLQTPLVFVLAFLLRANYAVVFIVLYSVNNPWTMIPLAAMDYAFGHWFIEGLLHIDLSAYDPSWMWWINERIGPYILPYLGLDEFCFWCFIIGGNIIALSVSLVSYPCALKWSRSIALRKQT